jgi:hypothetical protein
VVTQEQEHATPTKWTNAIAVSAQEASDAIAAEENVSARTAGKKGGGDRRVIARLPVLRPLAHAVAAGHFGQDERGPVNPSADEVREITLNHAEEVIDLLADLTEAQRRGDKESSQGFWSEPIEAALEKYAEDFGDHAAQQLLAYCRRQLLINEADKLRPGHKGR